MQSVSTIPDSVRDRNRFSTAEVAIHPSGKFLYVSNRGHDSISLFGINEESGKVALKSVEPTIARHPVILRLLPVVTDFIRRTKFWNITGLRLTLRPANYHS